MRILLVNLLNCLAIDLDLAIAFFFSSSLTLVSVGDGGLCVDTFPSDVDSPEEDDASDEDDDSSGCDLDGDRQSTELDIG